MALSEPTPEGTPRKRRTLAERAAMAAAAIVAIPLSVLHWSRRPAVTRTTPFNPFVLPDHPPGVGPRKGEDARIAQDEDVNASFAWAAQNAIYSAYAEGLVFLGFAYLATLSQRPEYRVITETIASEMTREWVEFKSVSNDEDKADRIKAVQKADRDYGIQELLRKATEGDGFFGRGHIFVDNGEEGDDLKSSIGDGRNRTSKGKVGKGSKKLSFRSIEAMWCYPTDYNSNNPLKPDWYKPQHWFVMQNEVHHTRLLTLVSREMPDLLKPAYSFGGLSLSQMVKPYIDNWLRTRQSVSDMLHSFAVWVLKTNFAQRLGLGGNDLENRVELFNNIRDNRGTAVIDKESEEIENVSAPLGGLSDLQAQAQEQPAAIAQIPLVKYLGLQAKGLNACLTGDTLIETDRGYTAIKDVRPGQRVMTRNGLASVAKAGCTGYATELIEITTVDGAILRCTADHPIWLPSINAFANAASVRSGDLLLCRGASGTSRNTADRLPTAGVFGGTEAMAIMPPGPPKVAVASVRRVPAKEFVYDIQVAPGYLPEFFANGICVHNSSEGEIRVFYDRIHANQERLYRKPLTTIYGFIQLALWGEIDEDITFDFVSLWQLDEAGKAAIQQTKATTRDVDIASGVISPEEGRKAVAADPDSQYAGLDLDAEPAPGQEAEESELENSVGGEGGQPGAPNPPLGGPKGKQTSRLGNLTNRAANFGGALSGDIAFDGDSGTPEGARKAWQDRQRAIRGEEDEAEPEIH